METLIIIFKLLLSILIFGALFIAVKFISNKLEDSENKALDPLEYFPEEEFQTITQFFYLILMLIFFIFILYILVVQGNDFIGIAVLQVIVSLYVALVLDYSSWSNKILFFLLVPYEAIAILVFNEALAIWPIYLIHVLIYLYFMKFCYDRFNEYTQTNGLGITIVLLFTLIFVSFIITSIVEGVDPLNSLVMVSNAFTSNGYAILGNSSIGKLNSLMLVWGGYVLSGVGTATLTAAILQKYHEKREDELNKRLDELESLIKNNQE